MTKFLIHNGGGNMWSVFCLGTLVFLTASNVNSDQLWWERGADNWYYKDDWKGLCLSGGRSYTKTIEIPDGAVEGWIVVWGDRGYKLKINDQTVGENLDGGLIDDYDISNYLKSLNTVTLTIESNEICAEGEIIGKDGKVYPFITDKDWLADSSNILQTKKMAVGPSSGAYHRAHNGKLMTYNDEERGKTSIAKCLARIQKLNDQGIFLMRRLRIAEEIVSFDQNLLWRVAERISNPLIDKALYIIRHKAVPAQKSGKYIDAIALANESAVLITSAEMPVLTATNIYQKEREILHLENCASMLDINMDVSELKRLSASAREIFTLSDWASSQKVIDRIGEPTQDIKSRIQASADLVGGVGDLDEFPEDRFAWLNSRELMGNGPSNWQFSMLSGSYIDLSGRWNFRTDPDNIGLKEGWHSDTKSEGWKKIIVPMPWERQGFQEDNLNSPANVPYKLDDARCGDKPYNGFAWYKKSVYVPEHWQGKKLMLSTGNIQNWGRIFVNGKPINEGELNPPQKHEIPSELLNYGKENLIAIQVYNHDNFGGIASGQIALYVDGFEPALIETPGPLSYVKEYKCTNDGHETANYTFLAGAMSPAVVVATDSKSLGLWGWESKGYRSPSTVKFVTKQGAQTLGLGQDVRLRGEDITENWILLQNDDEDVLIVLEQRPIEIVWEMKSQCFRINYTRGSIRALILQAPVLQTYVPLRDSIELCRFWTKALRRYPVCASECVKPIETPLMQKCAIKYNYLDFDSFDGSEPITLAPVPMLVSYGLRYNYPDLQVDGYMMMIYDLIHAVAPYLVIINTDTIEYKAPAVDRSKVMKGVGELFGKPKAEYNIRGGVTEDEMFKRMAEWGFNHCRYAWAFHADWDVPLVKFMGGPIIEDNEALWKRLDEFVEKCNSVGMQMMLCWFFNEDSPQRDVGGAVRNSTRYWKAKPETKKNAFELWRRIAERYAHLPEWAISYDFFNEPAYMNADHWKEVMKELTAIIRSVDKKHLIVWESADGWAQPQWSLWMEPVDDKNVLYSFHHYGKHWGYAYDEYYPSYQSTTERTHIDPWIEAILFSIKYNVPIHCGEFGISMIQPDSDGEAWLNDYLALFERFGIGWNWWNYSGGDIYRTGLAAGDRISPYVPILTKWMVKSGWGCISKR
jgi:hypothetical protein